MKYKNDMCVNCRFCRFRWFKTDRNDNLRRFVIKDGALIFREKGAGNGFLRTFENSGGSVRRIEVSSAYLRQVVSEW